MSAIPVSRATYRPKSNYRTASRRKTVSGTTVITYVIGFVLIAWSTFIVSNLAGNVLMEKARREGIRSAERARESRASVAVLRRSIESMTNFSALNEWAVGHGFLAPEQLSHPSVHKSYVAYNR